MFDQIELGSEFFEGLMAIDARIAQQVQSGACRFCGGRLHRGDYPRKPRGGVMDVNYSCSRTTTIFAGRHLVGGPSGDLAEGLF